MTRHEVIARHLGAETAALKDRDPELARACLAFILEGLGPDCLTRLEALMRSPRAPEYRPSDQRATWIRADDDPALLLRLGQFFCSAGGDIDHAAATGHRRIEDDPAPGWLRVLLLASCDPEDADSDPGPTRPRLDLSTLGAVCAAAGIDPATPLRAALCIGRRSGAMWFDALCQMPDAPAASTLHAPAIAPLLVGVPAAVTAERLRRLAILGFDPTPVLDLIVALACDRRASVARAAGWVMVDAWPTAETALRKVAAGRDAVARHAALCHLALSFPNPSDASFRHPGGDDPPLCGLLAKLSDGRHKVPAPTVPPPPTLAPPAPLTADQREVLRSIGPVEPIGTRWTAAGFAAVCDSIADPAPWQSLPTRGLLTESAANPALWAGLAATRWSPIQVWRILHHVNCLPGPCADPAEFFWGEPSDPMMYLEIPVAADADLRPVAEACRWVCRDEAWLARWILDAGWFDNGHAPWSTVSVQAFFAAHVQALAENLGLRAHPRDRSPNRVVAQRILGLFPHPPRDLVPGLIAQALGTDGRVRPAAQHALRAHPDLEVWIRTGLLHPARARREVAERWLATRRE